MLRGQWRYPMHYAWVSPQGKSAVQEQCPGTMPMHRDQAIIAEGRAAVQAVGLAGQRDNNVQPCATCQECGRLA